MTVPIDERLLSRGHAVFDSCTLAHGHVYMVRRWALGCCCLARAGRSACMLTLTALPPPCPCAAAAQLDQHLTRLRLGADMVGIPVPWDDASLKRIVLDTAAASLKTMGAARSRMQPSPLEDALRR